MQRFAYTGRAAGNAVSGELEGNDVGAVAAALQARGIAPLTITAAAGGGGSSAAPARGNANANANAAQTPDWLAPRITPIDLMLFSRQLHTLLRAGVPILRALAGLQESCVNTTFRRTLGELRQRLEAGHELSMCLAQQTGVFDGFYVAMVRVGEMTGRLDEVLDRLAQHLAFEIHMRQQVKAALRYPVFVVLAMVAAIAVINVMVIPAFATVFAAFKAELPLATRFLLFTSRVTLDYGWAMALVTVGTGLWWRKWKTTTAGRLRWDHLTLRLPLAGPIVRQATLARFARSFSLAMKSGLPIEQTLTVTAQTVANAHVARKVEGMREAVERGDTILRAAVATGIFTPVVLQMIGVGEETGAIDELMDEVAQLYDSEVQYALKTLSQQIEPILVVFLGVMVLVLALGVFLPMWDLGQATFKK